MPWKSVKQKQWGHSPTGIKALGGKKAVDEWDKATKGKKLPKYAPKKKGKERMIKLANELDKAGIPYEWRIFTNDSLPIPNENVNMHLKRKVNNEKF